MTTEVEIPQNAPAPVQAISRMVTADFSFEEFAIPSGALDELEIGLQMALCAIQTRRNNSP